MTSKFALVIANTEYQDASFAKLTAPGKDAEEFAYILRQPELAAFDDVQVLLNEGESKTRRSIARFFAERKRDDLLLLYFSGHGVRNEVGQLFLAANDTEISILEASGIPAEFVTASMNNSRSQRQLLILDCCNSGAFAHGSKSAVGVGKSMGIATAFEGSGFGRVVLTATDATQYAWEGDKVIGDTQKSVFTHFLIEGLKGDADRDGDGRIDIDELYDYAYEQVVRRTPKQTPGKWSYKQQGDIVLRENLKPREVKPAPLPSDLLELLSYPNFSARKAGIQELIILLDGKHLGLARAAEEKLREMSTNDASLDLRKTASDALSSRGFVVEQSVERDNLHSFQQSPQPVSVETPKEKHKEEKKIRKPVATVSSPQPHSSSIDKENEKKSIAPPPKSFPRKVASRETKARQQSAPTESKQENVLLNRSTKQSKVLSKLNRRFIVGIVSVLLMVSLLIWSGVKLLNNPAVAEVNGETIALGYWQERIQASRITLYNNLQTYQFYQQNFGMDTSKQQEQLQALLQSPEALGEQVLSQLIDETLIRQESQKRGITVTNDEVDTRIQEVFEYFPNGTPTPTITPTEVSLPTLTTAQLALLYPEIPTSTNAPDLAFTPSATTRSSTPTPLPLPLTAMSTATPYTFSGYKDQYTKNIKSLKDWGVSESTFRSAYENQIYREKLLAVIAKDVPHIQEGALVRHILVDSEQLANDLYSQLTRGEDFAILARNYSKDTGSAANGGNLGWFFMEAMIPEFEQAAFSQKIGEIGKPVKSQYGYHIIQVIAREDIPVSASQYEQLRQTFFTDWLTKIRDDEKATGKITTSDIWKDNVPTLQVTLTTMQPQ